MKLRRTKKVCQLFWPCIHLYYPTVKAPPSGDSVFYFIDTTLRFQRKTVQAVSAFLQYTHRLQWTSLCHLSQNEFKPPFVFKNYSTRKHTVHEFNTKQSYDLYLQRCHSSLDKKFIKI